MINQGYFKKKFKEWRSEIFNHKYLIFFSLLLVAIVIVIDIIAGNYVTYTANVKPVPDLILNHFGPYDLRILFVGAFLVIFSSLFIYPLFFRVKKLHIILIQFSFLLLLRSIFIIFTHLQTPVDAISGSFPGFLDLLKFRNDLFFSGHVAFPFLGFWVFNENKKVRYFFLISSILMAVTVLGMHQHYSIDVFAAFFITYGSYKMVEWTLKKFNL